MTEPSGLHVLVVDDVAPALDELCQLLREAPGVTSVEAAGDALTALRLIPGATPDAVFLDISMPGMDGLELAGLLGRMTDPPAIVFVTAFEQHAVSAYGVGAVDYLLKPVSAERLGAALSRVQRVRAAGAVPAPAVDELAAVPVELGGRTRFVRRAEVRFAEAHGDYVRLHTRGGSHLVRIPISRLEEHWRGVGYVRVHRSYLLAVHAVQELRSDVSGGLLAHTDVGDVPVSRRHARELRDRLLEAATRGVFDPARGETAGDRPRARPATPSRPHGSLWPFHRLRNVHKDPCGGRGQAGTRRVGTVTGRGGRPPRRVAVTSPQTRIALAGRHGPPARAPRLTAAELERAEEIRRLQLRRAVTALLAGALFLVGLPLLLALVPALDDVRLIDVPVSWLAVAVLPWPVLAGLAWWQLRRAEAAEVEPPRDGP